MNFTMYGSYQVSKPVSESTSHREYRILQLLLKLKMNLIAVLLLSHHTT